VKQHNIVLADKSMNLWKSINDYLHSKDVLVLTQSQLAELKEVYGLLGDSLNTDNQLTIPWDNRADESDCVEVFVADRNGQEADSVFVSVIIPVYNTSLYLEECLDSIINQSLKEIEILCFDDGSTDNSLDILKSYALKDNRLKVYTQTNMGQGATRNTGIRKATGQYVHFMDSDDILDTSALEYAYKESVQHDLDVIYFDGTSFYETEQLRNEYSHYLNYYDRKVEYSMVTTGEELFKRFVKGKAYIVQPCMQLSRRAFLLDNSIFFPKMAMLEDNVFALKCLVLASRATHRKKQFFKRRVRENSTMIMSADANPNYRMFINHLKCYLSMLAFLHREGSKFLSENTMKCVLIILNRMINAASAYFRHLFKD
jgi:glycosyltransferase involved in cell wall biosynthesis